VRGGQSRNMGVTRECMAYNREERKGGDSMKISKEVISKKWDSG